MSDVDAEEHFLSPYLSRRLPELGLDYETYGPYCLGAVGGSEEEEEDSSYNEEELDGIIELLQSSSETHSDDAGAWADLRAEIVRRTGEWRRAAGVRKRREAQTAKEAEEEKLRRAKAEAEAYEEILREKKAHHGETPEEEEKEEEEKAQRDALLNRFAYEKEEDGDNEGGPVASNKDAAAQAQREHVEKVREQSSKSRESKAEARQKNKEVVKLKADKKEERRKKAAKGERKR